MKSLILSFLLTISNLVIAYGQEFPFTVKILENISEMGIDQFNRFMNDSKWKLIDIENQVGDTLAMMEFGLPTKENREHYKATISIHYSDKILTNRLFLDLPNTHDYDNLKDQIIKSDYKLIKNFKKISDDYDEYWQVFQNQKYTFFCIMRDNGKYNKDQNGNYSPFYTYHLWLYANSDFKKNVNFN